MFLRRQTMSFVDCILPILSFIVACISVILTFVTYKKYKKANEIAEEANKFAKEANKFAKEANEISRKLLNAQIAPEIKLTRLGIDPTKAKVYGGENITWIGKTDLPDELYKIIINTARTNSIAIIDNTKYLLINLCNKDTDKDNIGIILDAFYFELECAKNQVSELMILKAYSLLNSETPFGIDIQINTHIDVQTSTITIPIAYACPENRESSLNLGNIAKMAKETTKEINLMKKLSETKKYISFIETAYLIKCRTLNNDVFLFSLYMGKNDMGELETVTMCGGDKLYNEKYEQAKKRAGREIQQLAVTQ